MPTNPFMPGAGVPPPHLAGRAPEKEAFAQVLQQQKITTNMVLTGLRGLGKTVLVTERFLPMAIGEHWLWAGSDMSETASLTEERMATRILTDLGPVTSQFTAISEKHEALSAAGFEGEVKLNATTLSKIYSTTPGLSTDKLKKALLFVWEVVKHTTVRGVVFSYDEAQVMTDHAADKEFPLQLLLEVFKSIQLQGAHFILLLTGLPPLFSNLVESRTYSERMFRVVELGRLTDEESREAILKPIEDADDCDISLVEDGTDRIVKYSHGYPYFIQFMCKAAFDVFLQRQANDEPLTVDIDSILARLDTDFFSGRWLKCTNRQREFMKAVAYLDEPDGVFSIQDVKASADKLEIKGFSNSLANQMLALLTERGLIFKHRHGSYSFAVPLFGGFIRRQDSN